ncbi:probable inactive nicotinamidase At3g16190 isoform X2 [Alnus glutinosa]|uniref:probable inactive nicotinamidase At3g16190 isoform X2 n=1 Tax=Alnus glutinosa TaxID=3517 RepID=UPI002D770F0C|nr:probable inactive nicotinamidase At3g16190 isoform X2 [Alnus glutinosa]
MADNSNRTALLVIDMQKDFIHEDGLSRVNGGRAVVPNVIKAVQVARQRGILIVWGSVGAELVDGLVIKEGDYKLVKMRFSAFFATHLHSLLQGAGINNLVITGVQTPNCIRQTVFDAVALDYQSVTVIVDATAAATPDIHVANIFDMKNVGVATPTLQEWCESNT